MQHINIYTFMLTALLAQTASLPSFAQAADITYPGAPLSTSPFGSADSLFPGTSLTDNTVTITNGAIPGEAYGGVTSGSETVSGNAIIVTGNPTIDTLYGGRSGGIVSGNTVIFNSGTIGNGILGGRSVNGDVMGNSVTVNGGGITNAVRGGQSDGAGQASFNSVTITDGLIGGTVTGGLSNGAGQASFNTVNIAGGSLAGADGGRTASGDATNNVVRVSGGSFSLDITGGFSSGTGHALNNLVQINNLTTAREISGGLAAGNGDARGNTLEIFNGSTRAGVFGGRSQGGNAVDNRLVLRGGIINNNSAQGGYSQNGSVLGNTVEMTGGTVGVNLYGGRVNSASGNGVAVGNTVILSGGNVLGSVYGAQNRGNGASSGNLAQITGGSVGAGVYGGYSENGPATGNTIEVSDGGITGKTYGGFSNGAAAAGGNRVRISGGRFGNDIHGGFSASGSATGNIVELSGTPDISAATIYGGLSSGSGNVFSGNVFSVRGFRGSTKGILNFETYNFVTPALGNGETQIHITGGAPTGMDNTTVNLLGMEGGAPYLHPGDSIVLIDKVTGSPASANGGQVPKGVAVLYDFDISTADGTLRATLRKEGVNPDAEILPSGRAAATSLLGQSAGLAAERLLEPEERKAGPTVYAVGTGAKYHYTTDPSVDIQGFSFIAGLDWRLPAETVDTVLGVFVEGGHGDYDARYGQGRSETVTGDGNIDYYGAGVLGFIGLPSGPYAEASLRGGRVQTDFGSDYTRDSLGGDADYELSNAYYGAHGGLGWLWRPSERSVLNVYGKYLWLRQDQGDATILGDKVRFKAVDSQRVRTGARLSHTFASGFAPYSGVACEYEFDGKVRAAVNDFTLGNSSLKGGTVIGELGGTYKNGNGFFLDAGVKGFELTREGFAGHLQIGIEF